MSSTANTTGRLTRLGMLASGDARCENGWVRRDEDVLVVRDALSQVIFVLAREWVATMAKKSPTPSVYTLICRQELLVDRAKHWSRIIKIIDGGHWLARRQGRRR
jgi:hypothetical protein